MIITISIINLTAVPPRKPTIVPTPALVAAFKFPRLTKSAATAPMNGPTIIPRGPSVNIPKTAPITEPQAAALEPPYFLVPHIPAK